MIAEDRLSAALCGHTRVAAGTCLMGDNDLITFLAPIAMTALAMDLGISTFFLQCDTHCVCC